MTYELHLSGKHAAELGLIALIDDDMRELAELEQRAAQLRAKKLERMARAA